MDPGGYRAHMIFELAQSHYKVPGLYNSLLQHYQVNVADPSRRRRRPCWGRTSISSSRTSTPPRRRRSATRRIDMRRCRRRSISRARNRICIASGVTIPGLGTQGSMASVTIPASPVAWGVTIASNARNRDNAVAFVERLLGPSGRDGVDDQRPARRCRARECRAPTISVFLRRYRR